MTYCRDHQELVKKAMNYISNRTSCITFVPSTTTSPNFVTIAPGLECIIHIKSTDDQI